MDGGCEASSHAVPRLERGTGSQSLASPCPHFLLSFTCRLSSRACRRRASSLPAPAPGPSSPCCDAAQRRQNPHLGPPRPDPISIWSSTDARPRCRLEPSPPSTAGLPQPTLQLAGLPHPTHQPARRPGGANPLQGAKNQFRAVVILVETILHVYTGSSPTRSTAAAASSGGLRRRPHHLLCYKGDAAVLYTLPKGPARPRPPCWPDRSATNAQDAHQPEAAPQLAPKHLHTEEATLVQGNVVLLRCGACWHKASTTTASFRFRLRYYKPLHRFYECCM